MSRAIIPWSLREHDHDHNQLVLQNLSHERTSVILTLKNLRKIWRPMAPELPLASAKVPILEFVSRCVLWCLTGGFWTTYACLHTYIYIYMYIYYVYIYITYKKCTYGDMIGDLIHNVAGTKQPDFPSPRGWKQFRKNALVCSLDGHPLVHCCGASKQSRGSQCLTSSFQNNLDLESGECGSSTSKPPVVQT